MAVKKLRNLTCPFCGGTEFVKGRACSIGLHSSSAQIVSLRTSLMNCPTQTEIRVYCKNCGSLVRQYITNPELLEDKNKK